MGKAPFARAPRMPRHPLLSLLFPHERLGGTRTPRGWVSFQRPLVGHYSTPDDKGKGGSHNTRFMAGPPLPCFSAAKTAPVRAAYEFKLSRFDAFPFASVVHFNAAGAAGGRTFPRHQCCPAPLTQAGADVAAFDSGKTCWQRIG